MRSRRLVVAVVAGAMLMFVVLGFLSWKAKYGRGKTVAAVAVGDIIVLQQRVVGQGLRGPVAQDRLVSIVARNGDEVRRSTVLRGELVGSRDYDAIYRAADRLILYDAFSLEGRRTPEGMPPPPPLTHFGSMIDLGDSLLLLDTLPGGYEARASKLKKDLTTVWTTDLPWKGHDTRLVVAYGDLVVIVDADGMAGLDRRNGGIRWLPP